MDGKINLQGMLDWAEKTGNRENVQWVPPFARGMGVLRAKGGTPLWFHVEHRPWSVPSRHGLPPPILPWI